MRDRHPDDAEAQLRRRAVPADLGPLFADPSLAERMEGQA